MGRLVPVLSLRIFLDFILNRGDNVFWARHPSQVTLGSTHTTLGVTLNSALLFFDSAFTARQREDRFSTFGSLRKAWFGRGDKRLCHTGGLLSGERDVAGRALSVCVSCDPLYEDKAYLNDTCMLRFTHLAPSIWTLHVVVIRQSCWRARRSFLEAQCFRFGLQWKYCSLVR